MADVAAPWARPEALRWPWWPEVDERAEGETVMLQHRLTALSRCSNKECNCPGCAQCCNAATSRIAELATSQKIYFSWRRSPPALLAKPQLLGLDLCPTFSLNLDSLFCDARRRGYTIRCPVTALRPSLNAPSRPAPLRGRLNRLRPDGRFRGQR